MSRYLRYLAAPLLFALALVVPPGRVSVSAPPAAVDNTVRFASHGVKLPGPQLLYDAGFEVVDWDGDGKMDLLLPTTAMMSFAVHLNEGTRDRPRFGHAVPYPLN